MKIKKLGLVLLAVLMCSLIAAPAFAAKKVRLKIAGQHPADHEATQALNRIKDRLAKESDGRIVLRVYPASQLGDYTLVYEDVVRGSIDMAHIFIPSNLDPKLEINSIPYLVSNYAQLEKVFSPGSNFYRIYSGLHENQGVKLLGIYGEGFIGVGSKKEISAPADPTASKNILMRIPPMEVYKLGTEDLNFATTTIAYADLYTALQTGVADGFIGAPPINAFNMFREVIKYYVPYNIFVENTAYIMNQDKWESLSPADRELIASAFTEESRRSFKECEKQDMKYLDKMRDNNIEVVSLTADDVDRLSDFTRDNTWPKLEKKFGKDLLYELKKDTK